MKNLDKLTKKNLEELLIEQNLVDKQKLTNLSMKSHRKKIPIEKILIENGLIDENSLAELTCKQLNLPFLSLDNVNISEQLVKSIPFNLMKQYLFFPIEEKGEALTLIVCSPPRSEMLKDLAAVKPYDIFLFIDLMSSIEKYINEFAVKEEEAPSPQIGTTDVWETIFDKVNNDIMTEIMEKTQQRKESPLQMTQNRKLSPVDNDEIDDALSSVFPTEPANDSIGNALSSVFGDDEGSADDSLISMFKEEKANQGGNSEIDDALSSIFADDVLESGSSQSGRQRMSELSHYLDQNPLDKSAISEFVELAVSANKTYAAVEKLSIFAKTLIKHGRHDEAKRSYESILILDPENEEAINYLSD